MNWMELLADLAGHLAWPIALVLLACIFRKPLAALIGDLSEGEAGPSGVKFKRAWQRTAEDVARSEGASEATSCMNPDPPGEADTPNSPPSTPTDANSPSLLPIERFHGVIQPELAIQGAQRRLAIRLHELLGDGPVGSSQRGDDIAALATRVHSAGLISAEVLNSIEGLGVLYNLAQAAPERVTQAQAQEFQVLAKSALYTLSERRLGRLGRSERSSEPASPRTDDETSSQV